MMGRTIADVPNECETAGRHPDDERQNMSTDPVDPREASPSSTKRSMVITALEQRAW